MRRCPICTRYQCRCAAKTAEQIDALEWDSLDFSEPTDEEFDEGMAALYDNYIVA